MLNKAIIMGRLCADPEMRHTQNQIPVTSFTIAVNRTMQKDITDFIEIVAWRGTAEFICKYMKKGMQIAVSGSIQTRSWRDKEGNNRKSVEVVADEVFFADGKRDESKSYEPANQDVDAKFRELDDDEDLPF